MIRVLLILLLLTATARAATVEAASPERADVVNALALCAPGDLLSIPAGTAYWSSGLAITNMIWVRGAGTNLSTGTIIVDEMTTRSSGTAFWNLYSPTNLVSLVGTNRGFLLSDITFRGGTTNTADTFAGMLRAWGGPMYVETIPWAISNIFIYQPNNRPMEIRAHRGVATTFTVALDVSVGGIAFDGRLTGFGTTRGDETWATNQEPGEIEMVYLEDFGYWLPPGTSRAFTDGFGGARYAARFGETSAAFENHGTETTGRPRGTRYMEGYGLTMTGPGTGEYAGLWRSGSGLFASNVVNNYPGLVRMVDYRQLRTVTSWGQANGTNNWDNNDLTDGAGTPGGAGDGVFDAGTATSGSGSLSLVDTAKSWTPDEWVGFHVLNLDASAAPYGGLIVGNDVTTLTIASASGAGGSNWSIASGDGYEIVRVDETMDMVGKGKGDLLSGGESAPINTTTGTPAWPNQADEPVYIWGNSGAVTAVSTDDYSQITSGEHYVSGTAKPGWAPFEYPHPYLEQLSVIFGESGEGGGSPAAGSGRSVPRSGGGAVGVGF